MFYFQLVKFVILSFGERINCCEVSIKKFNQYCFEVVFFVRNTTKNTVKRFFCPKKQKQSSNSMEICIYINHSYLHSQFKEKAKLTDIIQRMFVILIKFQQESASLPFCGDFIFFKYKKIVNEFKFQPPPPIPG